ncbi:HNH endonuclease [Bernardetia sp. OM2101]|uniref:HNH endonuclease n=1 Tax=Bernardetia sp. OM2101 TaxID=3344876 RepID=UPI0035CEC508
MQTKAIRKSYRNVKWCNFAKQVKERDNLLCTKCNRPEPNVILQVHHKRYVNGKSPWEYELNDCVTLCKGCHAREHRIIEPNEDWTLIETHDLGDLSGICERRNCDTSIRHENIIYHANWGYLTVGSTCVEYLTDEEQKLSQDIIKIYKSISRFINSSEWEKGVTEKGANFIYTKYNHHFLRIYGNENYAFQIGLKKKRIKYYDYQKTIQVDSKKISQIKQLAYITLRGISTTDEKEKELLRNIYKNKNTRDINR